MEFFWGLEDENQEGILFQFVKRIQLFSILFSFVSAGGGLGGGLGGGVFGEGGFGIGLHTLTQILLDYALNGGQPPPIPDLVRRKQLFVDFLFTLSLILAQLISGGPLGLGFLILHTLITNTTDLIATAGTFLIFSIYYGIGFHTISLGTTIIAFLFGDHNFLFFLNRFAFFSLLAFH